MDKLKIQDKILKMVTDINGHGLLGNVSSFKIAEWIYSEIEKAYDEGHKAGVRQTITRINLENK